LLADDFNRARTAAGQYADIFGKDRFFIELQDHDLEDQRRINPQLVNLAKEIGVSTVATNDCHFLRPDDRYIQDVMICIQTGKKLSEENRFHASTAHHHFKSADDMAYRFRWVPEAVENTLKIAEMVEYDPPLDQFHFPEFIPPDGSSPEDYLKKNAIEGLKRRLPNPPEGHVNRLNFELDIICSMGFASYMLIVADFVKWAKDQNIPVGPGRGSAAGCLVSYSMGIIDIDPIFYGLQFERFLNPARKSMPDIDIDFDPVGRADVINYVTRMYGEEHVCQIITFNRLKARAAIRDTGRVMDIPLSETDKVAKMIPWQADLDEAIKRSPEFQEYYESNETTKNWIDTARKIENLTRNASIHAAGVVICKDPIWYHAPVQVMEGESGSVCMYSMNDAERVGLVKMDFLGLRTLAYLREACNLIKQNRGKEISLLDIPLDDSATFDLLGKGDVLGVFQMEGGGMRDLLMAIAPDRIEDLIACIALFRPGPMENDLHNSYARRKNKKEQVSYRHELLKPILEPTYGILTYQEQISLILQALGGIDLGTASIVIKLISKKKDRESIARYKEGFLKGAREHGIERNISREIWNEMEAFAGYGFNKAHSAAYGFIAYQTAYLKANFPLEFYAAYLSSEMHNQDKIALIVDEMKRKKIKLLPPDVNSSHPVFTVEGEGIRYGLGAIKGVGIQAVESIVDGIKENGPYKDIFQLASTIDLKLVNKGVLEALVAAGACDKLTGTRHAMLEAIPAAIEHGKRSQEDAIKGQVALFMPSMKNAGPALPDLEEFKLDELLNMEKQSLGFYLSHHPLEDVWEKMEPAAREKISDLNEMRDGRMVRVGGM
ncbi:MAG: DNA polymerase III subunit alpha, partial [bacterium]